ncbi:hypothetical protein DL770_008273 [Monosporascus sp. CRB-9-2]|nr:hypothetical protein DL770_008273 [Monosporascus sp. CRB-9-2]
MRSTRSRNAAENDGDEDERKEPEPDVDPNLAAAAAADDDDDDDNGGDSENEDEDERPAERQRGSKKASAKAKGKGKRRGLGEPAERLPKAEDSLNDIWTAEKEEELQASLVDNAYYQYAMSKGPPKTDRRGDRLRPELELGFTEPLSALALGSPCRDNVDLLAFFIRYAVACRTNDRRRYRMRTRNISCVFLRELAALVARTDGNDPVVELHAGLKGKWTADDRHIPDSAEVLLEIEKRSRNASVPERRAGEDEESFAPYPVLTEDLTSVLKAFKNAKHKVLRMYPDPQERATVPWNAVEGDDLGKLSLQDWNVLRGPLIVEEMRFLRKRRLSEQLGLARPEEEAEEEQAAGRGEGDPEGLSQNHADGNDRPDNDEGFFGDVGADEPPAGGSPSGSSLPLPDISGLPKDKSLADYPTIELYHPEDLQFGHRSNRVHQLTVSQVPVMVGAGPAAWGNPLALLGSGRSRSGTGSSGVGSLASALRANLPTAWSERLYKKER